MASQNSTGFDPKSLSHDEQMEYNENLYKKLLPTFKRHITVDIMHTTVISEKLQTSEMEKVEKKRDNEGDQAAAAYLLQILYKKSDWFNCLITAMEDESNKLTDLIPPFLKLKGEVDEDWLKKHRRPTKSSSPESRSHTDGIFSPSGIPQSDFELKGADGYGMHRDGNCEDSTGSTVTAAGSSQVPLLSRDADNSSADTYIDARSTKPKSASSIPGGERQNHPGLKDALSFNPNKDFERDFVRSELGAFQAFSLDEEEHQITERLQPYLHKTGTYVIWYWSLAKRPAICVVGEEGRILTFVVHKSSKDPRSYFVNKKHKKSSSLKKIVKYHIDNSILYTREEKNVKVHLKTPVQRYTQRN